MEWNCGPGIGSAGEGCEDYHRNRGGLIMRLSDVLSKPPKTEYKQVEGFLVNKQGNVGQMVKLQVGTVSLNYFCEHCEDLRTFSSQGQLECVFISKNLISIDCVLKCVCGTKVGVWFLVESEDDITLHAPKVRIAKRSEKLQENVKPRMKRYGDFDDLLSKAELAYREELGAGSIVYLRKIFEKITIQTANAVSIQVLKPNGRQRPFKDLLEEVDRRCHIVPSEFSANGYRLFGELSDVVHGDFDEQLGLAKFEPLYRLVIGILENVRNREELSAAKKALGWSENSEEDT